MAQEQRLEEGIVSLHIGQTGVNLAGVCWELFCLEHNIRPDGEKAPTPTEELPHVFFSSTHSGKRIPRALLVDTDPESIDEVRISPQRRLFSPNLLLSGSESAASLFSEGRNQTMLTQALHRVRRLADECDYLQGFLLFNSVEGGTGSGFTSLLLEALADEYGKKLKLAFPIYPSSSAPVCSVESYNAVLATHALLKHSDLNVVFSNEAVRSVCQRFLRLKRPSLSDLNAVIGRTIASVTKSFHFDCASNTTLADFHANCSSTYDRFKFLIASSAPYIPLQHSHFERPGVIELAQAAFSPGYALADCDFTAEGSKIMALNAQFIGEFSPAYVNVAINFARSQCRLRFVDWAHAGLKCHMMYYPSEHLPASPMARSARTVHMVANTSAIVQTFSAVTAKFDSLFSKRTFLHSYGVEEEEMKEARADLTELEGDYAEVERDEDEEAVPFEPSDDEVQQRIKNLPYGSVLQF